MPCNGCNYLSMLGLKLNHVSKRGHWWLSIVSHQGIYKGSDGHVPSLFTCGVGPIHFSYTDKSFPHSLLLQRRSIFLCFHCNITFTSVDVSNTCPTCMVISIVYLRSVMRLPGSYTLCHDWSQSQPAKIRLREILWFEPAAFMPTRGDSYSRSDCE